MRQVLLLVLNPSRSFSLSLFALCAFSLSNFVLSEAQQAEVSSLEEEVQSQMAHVLCAITNLHSFFLKARDTSLAEMKAIRLQHAHNLQLEVKSHAREKCDWLQEKKTMESRSRHLQESLDQVPFLAFPLALSSCVHSIQFSCFLCFSRIHLSYV